MQEFRRGCPPLRRFSVNAQSMRIICMIVFCLALPTLSAASQPNAQKDQIVKLLSYSLSPLADDPEKLYELLSDPRNSMTALLGGHEYPGTQILDMVKGGIKTFGPTEWAKIIKLGWEHGLTPPEYATYNVVGLPPGAGGEVREFSRFGILSFRTSPENVSPFLVAHEKWHMVQSQLISTMLSNYMKNNSWNNPMLDDNERSIQYLLFYNFISTTDRSYVNELFPLGRLSGDPTRREEEAYELQNTLKYAYVKKLNLPDVQTALKAMGVTDDQLKSYQKIAAKESWYDNIIDVWLPKHGMKWAEGN